MKKEPITKNQLISLCMEHEFEFIDFRDAVFEHPGWKIGRLFVERKESIFFSNEDDELDTVDIYDIFPDWERKS